MLINPEKHGLFKQFLTETYEMVDFLVPRLSVKSHLLPEYEWSVVLNYLLLKSIGDNILSQEVETILTDSFELYKIITKSDLQNINSRELRRLPQVYQDYYFDFFETYKLNPYVLRRSLYSMKTNEDLKVLFALFGGSYVPQEQIIQDGTGALYFTKEDFKSKDGSLDAKIDILNDHMTPKKDSMIPSIALNVGHHWIAINSVDGAHLIYNDPASGRTGKLKINKRIPERYRFYLFRYNESDSIITKSSIAKFLESETEKELESVRIFTKNLVGALDDEIEELKTPNEVIETVKAEQVQRDSITKVDLDKGIPKTPEKPPTGDEFMKRIRKLISEQFTDYSKM